MEFWLVLALTSALLFSFVGILQRIAGLSATDKRIFALLFLCFASFWALLLVLIKSPDLRLALTPSLFASLFFYGIWNRWRFSVASKIEASSMILLSSMTILIPALGGVLYLNEPLSFPLLAGILLIISSALILALANTSARKINKRNLLYAFVLNASLGTAVFFDKINLTFYQPELYSLMIWSLTSAFVLPPGVKVKHLKKELKKNWKVLLLLSFIQNLAYFLALSSLKIAPVSKVVPIINLNLILGVLLSIPILKEVRNLKVKLLAALLAFLGSVLINS